jgi:hypothetical protein
MRGNDQGCRTESESIYSLSEAEVSGTFSIVAVDPEAGVCGAAVASKYPAVGRVVPYVRAGVGAFCTQSRCTSGAQPEMGRACA